MIRRVARLAAGVAHATACRRWRAGPAGTAAGAARPARAAAARRTERGFTLLEVLVATAILGVAVVTLLGLHARNLSLASEAETLTIAGALATDVLATARLDPALDEGAVRGTFAARRGDADGKLVLYGGARSQGYTWSREVLPTALPMLKQIRVRVALEGDDRILAELWAALRVKGASLQ